jgi:hypothetical protein
MTVTIFSFCILYHAHHSLYQVYILLIDSHLRHMDDNYLAIIHISVLTYNQLLFNNYITFLPDLHISTYCFVESIYDWMVTTPSSSISKPEGVRSSKEEQSSNSADRCSRWDYFEGLTAESSNGSQTLLRQNPADGKSVSRPGVDRLKYICCLQDRIISMYNFSPA